MLDATCFHQDSAFGGRESRLLLWIDDEVGPSDAIVRLLLLEGFRVDCAPSGAAGLAMALSTEYCGIILDLRLPDMPGLVVLERLSCQATAPPVLVLTGYPRFDTAARAMRLGAWDCQAKTILLDNTWMHAFRALADQGASVRNTDGSPAAGHESIRQRLLAALDDVLRARSGDSASDPLLLQQQLTPLLVHTLANPRLNVPLFLVCATALKLCHVVRAETMSASITEIGQLLDHTARIDTIDLDWRVQVTLSLLEDAGTKAGKLREEQVAATIGIDRAHLGRLIRQETRLGFRQWRWGVLLKPSLPMLAKSKEQVAQIAYRCGYTSSAQFNHDFRRLIGLSPTQYRQFFAN